MISTAKRDPFPPREGPGPCVYSPDLIKENENKSFTALVLKKRKESISLKNEVENTNLLQNEDNNFIPHPPPPCKNPHSRKSSHRNIV